MRNKIIAVNAVIVLIVGLLAFVIVRSTLTAAATNPSQITDRARHDAQSAAARFQLDGLRVERWLAAKAVEPATLDTLSKATASARGEAATALCDNILSTAKGAAAFEGSVPSLVALVDASGKIVGRNGSNLGRGDDLAALYAGLKTALATGHTGSDVWINKGRNDQYLASYAPVRDEQGRVSGAIAVGTPLNDELARVSDITTGRPLLLVLSEADGVSVGAHSSAAGDALGDGVAQSKEAIKSSIASGHASATPVGDLVIADAPLEAFGDGKRAALVAAGPTTLIDGVAQIPLSIFGVAALGLVFVAIGGFLLGNYISRPINQLEEGLLAILNGQSDKRFELDHAELGGLAFRIDQLLNQLMGIEEDTTDEEGRVSVAPTAANFTDAMAVEDRQAGAADTGSAHQLAAEPIADYRARIYREYIAAKKAIGEATDHITEAAFAARIEGMERDAAQKYGRPVRYQVQARGKEVILLAIQLPA